MMLGVKSSAIRRTWSTVHYIPVVRFFSSKTPSEEQQQHLSSSLSPSLSLKKTEQNETKESPRERSSLSSSSSSLTTTTKTTTTTNEPYLHGAIAYTRTCSTKDHLEFDRHHLWHPYSSMIQPTMTLPISHADRCSLFVEDVLATTNTTSNKQQQKQAPIELLDGMSSWWSAIWGYRHPTLNKAMIQQIEHSMSHVMFGGLTHRPATEVATAVLSLIHDDNDDNNITNKTFHPDHDLSKVFLADSGSVAVEVALKMALQYHTKTTMTTTSSSSSSNNDNNYHTTSDNNGNKNNNKTKIISLRSGYHGDTLHAMSVSDPVNGMHQTFFRQVLPSQIFVKRPPCDSRDSLTRTTTTTTTGGYCWGCTCQPTNQNDNNNNNNNNGNSEEMALDEALHELEDTLIKRHDEIAALILEPILQGAGGMRSYHPRYLQKARALCTQYDVLMICDEIATGFGRTGTGRRKLKQQQQQQQQSSKSSSSSSSSSSSLPKRATTAHEQQYNNCLDNSTENKTSFSSSLPPINAFASLNAGVQPDILCVGKALTGGTMTLGAVITTERVARGISMMSSSSSEQGHQPLMHGPTFMANPLACAVAVASTNMILQPVPVAKPTPTTSTIPSQEQQQHKYEPMWKVQVDRIEHELETQLAGARDIPGVSDVRVRGAVGVIELVQPIQNLSTVVKQCRELGVWLRPFGRLLYTMPPYIMTNDELQRVTNAMLQLAEIHGNSSK